MGLLDNLHRAVQQEWEQIGFMRQDIVTNINKVMDETAISQGKFDLVMRSFVAELYGVSDRVLAILSHSHRDLYLPTINTHPPTSTSNHNHACMLAGTLFQFHEQQINRLLLSEIHPHQHPH